MLTINIPTYNRPQPVFKLLNDHKKLFKNYKIKINIFDNSSNTKTRNIFIKFKNQININYFKNKNYISADYNFYQAYFHNDDEYILLLGDTYKINEILFQNIIKQIKKKKYDIVILNHASISSKNNIEFSDSNYLFKKMGSIATCMSTLIFHKSVFKKDIYKKYLNTNFIHAGILFEYAYRNSFLALYIGNPSIKRNFTSNSLSQKLNWSYSDDIFNITVINWQKFLNLLPSNYSNSLKKIVFAKFYRDLKIFNFKRLIYLRYNNVLSLDFILKYKSNFYDYNYPLRFYYLKLYIFCLIPKNLCSLIVKISNLIYR